MRRRATVPLLLLALLLPGCSAPPPAEEEEARPHVLALDGRWAFPRARAEALLSKAGVGPADGAAWFGGGILHARDPLSADYAAFEPAALARLAPGLPAPQEGSVVLSSGYAQRHGLAEGERVELRAWRWPTPLVATSFEMERTRPCDPAMPAKLCFAATLDETETELRLRVDEASQDLSFLPDMAELGAGAAPAWWNGTFVSPSGATSPFQAHVSAEGVPRAAEREGPMEPGTWVIRFHLETLRGRHPAGLAGIVRLREPGFHWFDDRLQLVEDPEAQSRAVLANATEARVALTVAGVAPFPAPIAGFDLLLAPADARTLDGAAPEHVGGLVLNATSAQAAAVVAAREGAVDPVTVALGMRPLLAPPPGTEEGGALLFRAPPGLDVASLPPVEGAGPPTLAVALRPGVGLSVSLEGKNLTRAALFLAHAGPDDRPAPFGMPANARWRTPGEALENLSRSRTLVLASDDLAARDVTVARLLLGEEAYGRVGVVVGVVDGGPRGALWASAPFVAGAGEPDGARVVLPLAPGADPAAVAERARAAWAPYGVAPEPSRKA